MALKLNTIPLDRDKIESSQNIMFDDGFAYLITPLWKGRDTVTYTYRHTIEHDSDDDSFIGSEAVQVDGDYIFMAGWSDGFVVYKMANDGSLTRVYYDYSDPHTNYLSQLILDPVNKKGWVARDYTDGIRQFDYSDIANGNIVWEQYVTYNTDGSLGLNSNRIGYQYLMGMVKAGNWIYYGGQDTTNAGGVYHTKQGRWNPFTGVFEELTVIDLDNYMRRGNLYYDEVTDRVYQTGFYNGELWVTINASSDTLAETYQINYSALGLGGGDDNYQFICIPMLYNRDHILIGGNYGHLDIIDISTCLGSGRTSDVPVKVAGVTAEYQYNVGFVSHPKVLRVQPDSELLYVYPYGHWFRKGGWIDMEFGNHVGSPRHHQFHQSRDYLEFGYGGKPKKVITADLSEYWLHAGYDYDGRYIYVYTEAQGGKIELATSSEIVFGNSLLNINSKNILAVQLNTHDLIHSPADTSYVITASNNGGSTWEGITEDVLHRFSSEGNELKIKISFTNPYYKATYIMSKGAVDTNANGMTVTLVTDERVVGSGEESPLDKIGKVRIARRRGLTRQRR